MRYGFADVEDALARFHTISDEKRSAFANRLKHLQRRGFPPGVNTGRGRAADYAPHHVFLLAVALELNQLGAGPEAAIDLINGSVGHIAQGVTDMMSPYPDQLGEAVLCRAPVSNLGSLYLASVESLQCGPARLTVDFLEQISRHAEGHFQLSAFSLSALAIKLPELIRPNDREHREGFWEELRKWAKPLATPHMIDWAAELGRGPR